MCFNCSYFFLFRPLMKWLHGASICIYAHVNGTSRSLYPTHWPYRYPSVSYKFLMWNCSTILIKYLASIMYTWVDKHGRDQSQEFKSTFSVDEPTGVWYVVSAFKQRRKRKITRVQGHCFVFWYHWHCGNHCQSLQLLVPMREHSYMR